MKTLIFGAGASRDFFDPILDTNYLTERILSYTEWERIIKKYKEHGGKNEMIVSADEVISLLNHIRIILPISNFEQLAEILDKICSYGFDNDPNNNLLNALLFILFGRQKLKISQEWDDIPFLFREIIAESILEMQDKHKASTYEYLSNLQKGFIRYLCEDDENIHIMSLNYDDCVSESLQGLGFEKGFYNYDERFLRQLDITKFMGAPRVVSFPHGHLKFQYVDNNNVTFWADSIIANDQRWEGIDGTYVGSTLTKIEGPFSYSWNTFISTGQTKDDGLNNLPYAVYYQRLSIDLAQSDTVIVIGYSFGDAHINRLLHSFILLHPNNKVLLIDFYDKTITMVDEYKDPNHRFVKYKDNLKGVWEVKYDGSGKYCALHQDEIDKINKLGYGQLFPQVYYYKNGYAKFLEEYEEVMKCILKQ